jgi:hypothetical protein
MAGINAEFDCSAELFSGSKSIEKTCLNPQAKLKPLDPGDYKLVITVNAKAKLTVGPKNGHGLEMNETFWVAWKVVVDDDGSLSFQDRKTGKLKYEFAMGIGAMTLDKYESNRDSALVGVEIEINNDRERRDFEAVLKGTPAPSKASKVVKFPAILNVGSFPTNVFEVKKIKSRPSGYSDWTGLKKFYDSLPPLTQKRIENGEKPGDLRSKSWASPTIRATPLTTPS